MKKKKNLIKIEKKMVLIVSHMRFFLYLVSSFITCINSATFPVSSSDQLLDVLSNIEPGDTIHLKDGTYQGQFMARIDGRHDAIITLEGSPLAILTSDPSRPKKQTTFFLTAAYWHLKGFTIENSKRGLVLDDAHYSLIQGLTIQDVDTQGIVIRGFSTHNRVEDCTIRRTGKRERSSGWGYGIYVGSWMKRWQNNKPDTSDYNEIVGNSLGPNITAEAVMLREGSCCGIIKDNQINGIGQHPNKTALIALNGNDYLVEGNVMENSNSDGIKVTQALI
jgi:hypothetical protein